MRVVFVVLPRHIEHEGAGKIKKKRGILTNAPLFIIAVGLMS
jgi:hypothetical protein